MSLRENEDEEGGVDLENNEEPTPGIGPQLGGDETGKMKAQLCSKGEECSDKIPKLMELDCNPGFRVCNSDCSTKEVAWKYEYDFDEDCHEEEEAEESEENKVFADDVEEERGMGENDFVADGREVEVEMEGDADSMSPSLSSASKEISAETAIGTKIIQAEICQADNEGSVDDIDELKTQGEISGRLGFGEKNFLQGNQKKDLGGVDGEAKAESIGGTIQGKMGPESENLNEEAKQRDTFLPLYLPTSLPHVFPFLCSSPVPKFHNTHPSFILPKKFKIPTTSRCPKTVKLFCRGLASL